MDRRARLCAAFDNFNPKKIAKYNDSDFTRLIKAEGMIKNRAKINATITNAQHFLEIQREFGSFDKFIWEFVADKTIHHAFEQLSDMPAETEESRAMSRELKRRGFSFVGPTICYSYMQAAGLVNDHLTCCFRYKQLEQL